jgi:hypothetical protein
MLRYLGKIAFDRCLEKVLTALVDGSAAFPIS